LLLQLDEPCRMSVFNRKARLVPVVLQLGEFGFHPEETKEHQLVNGHFLSCSSALSTSLSKKSGITHFCTVASFFTSSSSSMANCLRRTSQLHSRSASVTFACFSISSLTFIFSVSFRVHSSIFLRCPNFFSSSRL